MEGMTPTAVFYPNNSSPVDKRRQVIEGSSMLTDVSAPLVHFCTIRMGTGTVDTSYNRLRGPVARPILRCIMVGQLSLTMLDHSHGLLVLV